MYRIGNREIRTVCIVGAGNEGHYLMAFIGSDPEIRVNVLTSNKEGFGEYVDSFNVQNQVTTRGKLNKVSENAADVIPDADMVIFTVPSHIYRLYIDSVYESVSEGAVIGFIPGTGGVEFLFRDYIEKKNCLLFGSQRVPSGTKVEKRGSLVHALDQRRDMRIASLPHSVNADVCDFFHGTLGITTINLPNYLSVTFTPSNPILHTSRLYGMFNDYEEGMEWDKILSFYKEWNTLSSEMLLGCNQELQDCCKLLKEFDLSGVASLVDHYEIYGVEGKDDVERMTNKIRSLIYLKDNAPMEKKENGKYIPAFNSRYFKEDFPYGLAILRDFCFVCGLPTTHMDIVLSWFDKVTSYGLYMDGNLDGEGAAKLPLPHNNGLASRDDVVNFYLNLEQR